MTVSRTGELVRQFPDVAAVAYYLKAVAWAIPGHSPGDQEGSRVSSARRRSASDSIPSSSTVP